MATKLRELDERPAGERAPTKDEVAQAARLSPINAPHFIASSMYVSATGNDFALILSQTVPLQPEEGGRPGFAKIQASAIVTISPQSAKDFAIALSEAVRKYEAEWGVINTPYTRRLAQEKKTVTVPNASGKKKRP